MRLHKHFSLIFLIFIGVLMVGTSVYHHVEGWSLIDSAYFVFATVTTIGYGDFVPTLFISKLFTIVFGFVGIAMAFYLLTSFGRMMFERHVDTKIVQIKKSVKKEEAAIEKLEDLEKKKPRKRKTKR